MQSPPQTPHHYSMMSPRTTPVAAHNAHHVVPPSTPESSIWSDSDVLSGSAYSSPILANLSPDISMRDRLEQVTNQSRRLQNEAQSFGSQHSIRLAHHALMQAVMFPATQELGTRSRRDTYDAGNELPHMQSLEEFYKGFIPYGMDTVMQDSDKAAVVKDSDVGMASASHSESSNQSSKRSRSEQSDDDVAGAEEFAPDAKRMRCDF